MPILQQLESKGVHYFGKVPTRLEPTRELAGRFSRVLRVRVDVGDRAISVFVKRYQTQSGTPEEELRFRRYVITEHARTLLAAGCATATAGVARPIACLPDHFALVTEEAIGIGLDRLFRRLAFVRTRAAAESAERALRYVAGWLRDFQAGVPVVKTRVRNYRRYLDVRLQELATRHRRGFGEPERAAALAFFDAHSANLKPDDLALVPIHGDLCPSNILVRQDGVTVLDLGMSDDGTRYQDLAHLYLHVERAGRRLHLGGRLVERLKAALLHGFDPALDTGDSLFRLMLLQHVVCYLAQAERLEPDPTSAMSEWRSRRRVAWCLGIAGVYGAPHGGFPATGSRRSIAPHDCEVLGEQRSERCMPRAAE